MKWFSSHEPFLYNEGLTSIATGLTGGQNINCRNAENIGKSSMKKIINTSFSNLKFKWKYRVLPLSSISTCIQLSDENIVPTGPNLHFSAVLCKKTIRR